MQVSRQVEEFWDYEDKGIFWVTNQRIGYIGNTKSFSFPLDKLLSLNTGDGGLNIFKNGRTNPFVIYLDDYELPCAVISKLLND